MAKSLLEVFQDLERRIVLEMKRPDGGDELALIAPRLRLLSNELDRWKVPSPGKKAAVSPVVGAAGNAAAKVVTSTKKAVEKSGSISNKLVSRIQRSKESEEAAKKIIEDFLSECNPKATTPSGRGYGTRTLLCNAISYRKMNLVTAILNEKKLSFLVNLACGEDENDPTTPLLSLAADNLCKSSSSTELKLSDNDRLSIANQLFATDSSIDILFHKNGYNALHYAATNGCSKLLKYLLTKGEDKKRVFRTKTHEIEVGGKTVTPLNILHCALRDCNHHQDMETIKVILQSQYCTGDFLLETSNALKGDRVGNSLELARSWRSLHPNFPQAIKLIEEKMAKLKVPFVADPKGSPSSPSAAAGGFYGKHKEVDDRYLCRLDENVSTATTEGEKQTQWKIAHQETGLSLHQLKIRVSKWRKEKGEEQPQKKRKVSHAESQPPPPTADIPERADKDGDEDVAVSLRVPDRTKNNSNGVHKAVWDNVARTYAFKKRRSLKYMLRKVILKSVEDARLKDIDADAIVSRHFIRASSANGQWVDEKTTLSQILREVGDVEVYYEVIGL